MVTGKLLAIIMMRFLRRDQAMTGYVPEMVMIPCSGMMGMTLYMGKPAMIL